MKTVFFSLQDETNQKKKENRKTVSSTCTSDPQSDFFFKILSSVSISTDKSGSKRRYSGKDWRVYDMIDVVQRYISA